MRRSLFLVLLLSGCGKTLAIHASLVPYVSRFETIGNIQVDNLIARFGTLKSPIVGLCQTGGLTPVVTIDPTHWATIGESQREELIFHELGHCVLDRDHRDDRLIDGCPASIMNSYVISAYCFTQHQSEYYAELFDTDQSLVAHNEYNCTAHGTTHAE